MHWQDNYQLKHSFVLLESFKTGLPKYFFVLPNWISPFFISLKERKNPSGFWNFAKQPSPFWWFLGYFKNESSPPLSEILHERIWTAHRAICSLAHQMSNINRRSLQTKNSVSQTFFDHFHLSVIALALIRSAKTLRPFSFFLIYCRRRLLTDYKSSAGRNRVVVPHRVNFLSRHMWPSSPDKELVNWINK